MMRPMRFVLCLVVVTLVGCAMVQKDSRDMFEVAESPRVAFPRAIKATLAVGAVIVNKDATLGMISATVNQGGSLTVIVRSHGQGSAIEVVNTRASNYLGTITTAAQWRAAYQQQS